MLRLGSWRLMLAAPLAMLLLTGAAADAQPAAPEAVSVAPAVGAVLDAFASHPIVAFSDDHGLAQALDFYAAVVRDPRFAAEVGNLVVEFGGAAQQATLDRYLAGETVPYTELRKVWSDVVSGPSLNIGYMNIFAQVRATNMTLPPGKRIRVLLGEPPIDWSRIRTPAEHLPYQAQRQSYPVELVRREILAKGKKALLIYGGGHLYRERIIYPYTPGAAADPRAQAALRTFLGDLAAGAPDYGSFTPAWADRIRQVGRSLTLNVRSYGELKSIGFLGRTGGDDVFVVEFSRAKIKVHTRLDAQGRIDFANWEPTPYRDAGGTITDRIEKAFPGSVFMVVNYDYAGDKACNERFERAAVGWTAPALVQPVRGLAAALTAEGCQTGTTLAAEAWLYLGPVLGLTMSPEHPDIYLDEAYRREEDRRWQIQGDTPLPSPIDMRDYPATAKKAWP